MRRFFDACLTVLVFTLLFVILGLMVLSPDREYAYDASRPSLVIFQGPRPEKLSHRSQVPRKRRKRHSRRKLSQQQGDDGDFTIETLPKPPEPIPARRL